MACRMLGAVPLPEPMQIYFGVGVKEKLLKSIDGYNE